MPRTASPGRRIHAAWNRLHGKPGGAWLFSRFLAMLVPYTGTIHPRVVELRPGYAKVRMSDRRGVRNHLHSIHAIALMNLGEVTSGLAMTAGLPDDARGIVTALSMEYFKKARGTLTAESTFDVGDLGDVGAQREHVVEATIRDEAGDLVARATARWLVGRGAR